MKTYNILVLLICLFIINISIDIDKIYNKYNEDKYFFIVKKFMIQELQENQLEVGDIFKRNKDGKNKERNMLLIPQYNVNYDTLSNQISIIFDSIHPINRAILLNKNKCIAELRYPIKCTCHERLVTMDFGYGRHYFKEPNYYRSLERIFKKNPLLIFKDAYFERVWFYIDKNKKLMVFTYDLEIYSIEDFFKLKDLKKYSLPNATPLRYFK